MQLLQPLPLATAIARNRVMFGPHVTNLGDDQRCFTPRHTAYYERRARGGCGIIVTEGASVRCRLGCHRERMPCPRLAGGCLARPRRRPGQQRVQPARTVGAIARAGG